MGVSTRVHCNAQIVGSVCSFIKLDQYGHGLRPNMRCDWLDWLYKSMKPSEILQKFATLWLMTVLLDKMRNLQVILSHLLYIYSLIEIGLANHIKVRHVCQVNSQTKKPVPACKILYDTCNFKLRIICCYCPCYNIYVLLFRINISI